MDRTVLFGLDGATFTILDVLCAEGQMPCLKAFLAEGVRAELASTSNPLTPPAWTTLITGRTPGNHGIIDFIWAEERGDQVYFTLNNFRDIRVETIWSLVSRLGGRVACLNFPFMSPPPHVNGSIVPGLISWKHFRRSVYPADLYAKLKELPGFNVRELAWDFEREQKATSQISEEEHEAWVEYHLRREQQWYEILRFFLREDPGDLLGVIIDGVDKLQHVCWRYLDPDFWPAHPTLREQRVRQLCFAYFRRLDDFLGELLELAGRQTRVFIASDHGFGPTEKVFRVNRWLEENGYLRWAPTDHLGADEKAKVERLANDHFVYLDWRNTAAYAQSSATNGIHIRAARDGRAGGVADARLPSLCRELTQRLLELRDPETGASVVTRVMTKEEAYPGANNRLAPDLTLTLFDHGFVSLLNKEPIVWRRPQVAGTHRPQGVFLARGPGIRRGQTLPQQSIAQMASTLVYSLGLPVPADFEGGVIDQAFEPDFRARRPIQAGPATSPVEASSLREPAARPSAEEDKMIIERLRALGYVE